MVVFKKQLSIIANMDELFLGIDPGSRVTGFGIIKKSFNGKLLPVTFGTIPLKSELSDSEKLLIIFEKISQLIMEFSPKAVVVETQFFHKNVQSAIKIALVRSVALLAAAKHSLPAFQYTPREAKMAISKGGSTSKDHTIKMVKILLNLVQVDLKEDEADALSLAICHANRDKTCLNI